MECQSSFNTKSPAVAAVSPLPLQYGEDDDASVQSTCQDHGVFNGEDVPWHGCACGNIHGRGIAVFWIQCDGPCRSWFNVSPHCVNGLTAESAPQCDWVCGTCESQWKSVSTSCRALLNLTPVVWFRILQLTAGPTFRAAVLEQQIAPLNRAARHFVQGEKSWGLWDMLLKRDYQVLSPKTTSPITPERRASKRQRTHTNFLAAPTTSRRHPRWKVQSNQPPTYAESYR